MNKEKKYSVTDIQYNEGESSMDSKPYWDIYLSSIDPMNGMITAKALHKVSDSDVLQAIWNCVIPELREEIIKLKHDIVVLESKKKWYQFWK